MPAFNGPVSKVISGALIKVLINNTPYVESQQVQYSIDYGATEIFGIDSPYPQEITTTRAMVRGSISGLRLKLSGGVMGYSAVFRKDPADFLSTPYISIRIQDRSTQEDILYVPNAMVISQSFSVATRGVASLTFHFTGLVSFEPLDRVDPATSFTNPIQIPTL